MTENYEKLNEALGDIEHLLSLLAEQKELKGISITKWHWDAPDLMLSWKEGDLGKNIHVLIENGKRVKIEYNAWKDEDREEGERVRKYNNEEVEPVVIKKSLDEMPHDEIKGSLEMAYKKVADWKENNLCKEHKIKTRA